MLIKRANPALRVTGVDISPENIRIARALFESAGVRFLQSDLRDGGVCGSYDLIAMIDVHEHIPRADWARFHTLLAGLLSENGKLVITFPSPTHQRHLLDHQPDALQIVDEVIGFDDLIELARRIDAALTYFKQVSIWNRYDYVHAVFDRDMQRRLTRPEPQGVLMRPIRELIRRTQRWARHRYVQNKLKRG